MRVNICMSDHPAYVIPICLSPLAPSNSCPLCVRSSLPTLAPACLLADISVRLSTLSVWNPVQVRRGSEPTLNQVCAALPHFAPPPLRTDTSKRWSAAPIIDDDIQASSTPIKVCGGSWRLVAGRAGTWRKVAERTDSGQSALVDVNWLRCGEIVHRPRDV